MSFILDALKKSEHARQRQAGPALFEVKVVQPRRTLPIWVFVIAVLLLINVMTLGWILLSRGRTEPPAHPQPPPETPVAVNRTAHSAATGAPQPAAAVAAPTPQMPATGATQGPPSSTPAVAAPAQASSAALQQGPATTLQPGAANAPNPADFEPAQQPVPSASPGAAAAASGSLPLYAQIAGEPGSTLPPLHLDLHVYGPDPGSRFVMINMQKLRQGDALANGVSVVKIRPDGVVLSYQGREFLLPR